MKFKALLSAAVLILAAAKLSAQGTKKYYPEPAHPQWFKAIPMIDDDTPKWAEVMYTEDDNFVKIESLKKQYYLTHEWEKNIHVQNYKHWLKAVQNHVNEEGKVALPDPTLEFQKYESAKKATSKTGHRVATSNWINIGPDNTVSGGASRPTQANIFCLGVSQSNPSTLYAGMETGGIFKSTDKGLTWNPSSWDYAIGSPEEIKVDPLNENVVYVVDGTLLYKTTDGGTTWNLHYTSANNIEQLYIHTTNTSIIYAATRGGILKSINGGSTWTSKYTGYIFDIEAKPGTNDTLYVSIKNDVTKRPEIFISYDQGENWILKDSGFYTPSDLSVATVYGCKIGVTPADPDRIYAGIIANGKEGDNGWIGIYHSLDIGETWQNESGVDGASIDDGDGTWSYPGGSDMNTNWYVAGYSSGYHQGWYNFDMDVSETDPDKVWVGTIWVLESANKGANLEYIRGTRSFSMHADVQDIEVVGSDIWWASDGGLNYSGDECLSMETRMQGMSASDFWGFGQGWNEDVWAGGRYHNGNAAFHENYGAGNTLFLGGAESGTGYVNQLDNKKTYFSDIGDKLITTDINGSPQNIANLGLYPTESYFHFSYSEVEWHPYKANTVYVGKRNEIYHSTDGGSNFEILHSFAGEIRRFEISRADPNYIYAIVYHSYWDWRVERSTDGGLTFTELTAPTLTGGSWRNLSFTLNPLDKDEIWLASNSSNNGNKIFSSTDGGSTWTNRYATDIANQAIKDMIYHASPDGDKVYVMTNDNYFLFDKDQATWETFNTGLPVKHTGFMTLPFYRDGKIRMASAKGIWESPFDGSSTVQAVPMIDADSVLCARDTSQLESYSIIDQTGATWEWNITPAPQYISDINVRNPKVVFGTGGSYDISLTINAANGQTDTRLVPNMVFVKNTCQVDTIPGKAIHLPGNSGDYADIPPLDLNTNTLTMSTWIKPRGTQNDWAGILFCRGGSTTSGLSIRSDNELRYHWNGDEWGWSSGAYINLNVWNHVALVIQPTEMTIYLNGVPYSRSRNHAAEAFDASTRIGNDPNSGSRTFQGQIDEVCIWDRPLTQDEIRALRHLTKEDLLTTDSNLRVYLQFNEDNGEAFNKSFGNFHATLRGNLSRVTSTAPVGGGISEPFTITGASTISSVTGVDLTFGASGSYPNGEIVISRINIEPDVIPAATPVSSSYWVINNYGANETFSSLEFMQFKKVGNMPSNTVASSYILSTRGENDFGPLWADKEIADQIDFTNTSTTFSAMTAVTSFGQFIIDNRAARGWIGVQDTDWNNANNWGGGIIPSITDDVIIPPRTPFHPEVELGVTIRSILMQGGASFSIKDSNIFTTTGN